MKLKLKFIYFYLSQFCSNKFMGLELNTYLKNNHYGHTFVFKVLL